MAVDEENGIVWLDLDFGPGSIRGSNDVLSVWEAFKVYGGQIHAVEAFMKRMPAGACRLGHGRVATRRAGGAEGRRATSCRARRGAIRI